MSQHKCELCGTPVKVVGKTTKHYEPIGTVASVPSKSDVIKALSLIGKPDRKDGGTNIHCSDYPKVYDALIALLKDGKVKEMKPSERINEIIIKKGINLHDGEYKRFQAIVSYLDEQYEKAWKEPEWPPFMPGGLTGWQDGYNSGIKECIKAWNTSAERIQLVPLDKDKLSKFIKECAHLGSCIYDSDCHEHRDLVEGLCQTFGTPKINWPEIDDGTIQLSNPERIWKIAIDACRRAYEEAEE